MADYGLKRAEYIEAFMKAVDWNVALSRFLAASGRQVPEVLVGKSAYAIVTPAAKENGRVGGRMRDPNGPGTSRPVLFYSDSFIP